MNGGFLKAAIIGAPVGHSLSPLIHNFWLQQYRLPGQYDAREIQPGQLRDGLTQLLEDGYTGFSVTIPHKQAVMELCDRIDETARKIGAVNTLAVGADGVIEGTNTDWFGFNASLAEAAPGLDYAARPALVLGAGGAARGVIYGLQRAGVKTLFIANRTRATADALAEEFGAAAVDWDQRHKMLGRIGLLVNTTSSGMAGQPPLELNLTLLPPDAVVCDIVYKPRRTALLQAAAARGNLVVEGLGMLIHQARPAFERWTGVLPDVTEDLRKSLERKLDP